MIKEIVNFTKNLSEEYRIALQEFDLMKCKMVTIQFNLFHFYQIYIYDK